MMSSYWCLNEWELICERSVLTPDIPPYCPNPGQLKSEANTQHSQKWGQHMREKRHEVAGWYNINSLVEEHFRFSTQSR